MRLVDLRLLHGPNVYRLRPVVRMEVTLGRRRSSEREAAPRARSIVVLGRDVPAREWPNPIVDLVAWARRLRLDHEEGAGAISVHRTPDAGWLIAWPWAGAGRARAIGEAALDLSERNVSPHRRIRLTNTQARTLRRWEERIAHADRTPPGWVRDDERRARVVSVASTGPGAAVRDARPDALPAMLERALACAGRRVATPGAGDAARDAAGGDPAGAWREVLRRRDVDVAIDPIGWEDVLERGLGVESNDVSVLLAAGGGAAGSDAAHAAPEIAEVRATVARITRPDGWVVVDADDPFAAAVVRRVRGHVALVSVDGERRPAVRRHLAAGGRAYSVREGRLVELEGGEARPFLDAAAVPEATGGRPHAPLTQVLAAAAAARGLGASLDQVAAALR